MREPLLVEQNELLAVPDLVGRDGEKLAARRGARAEELVGVWRALHPWRQTGTQEVHEVGSAFACEQPAITPLAEPAER